MMVIGVTGSIGMGKSATARLFADLGCPTYDADAAVHQLYRGAAIAPIEQAFPGTTTPDGVDRARLSAAVLGDRDKIARLEEIVHPLVRVAENRFREDAHAAAARFAVLEIPLLFETGAEARCDAVVVCSAPADVQRARVLARPEITEEKLDAILARQMPDAEKRRRAHFVVDTSLGFDSARRQVGAIVRAMQFMA